VPSLEASVSRFVFFLFASFLLALVESASADFTISSWGLLVDVSDYSASEQDYSRFASVQNPFQASHTAALPSRGSAAAEYDISWLMDYGSFNISAQLAAQDGHSVESLATGTIYLQSDADLVLSLDSLLDYDLPTWGVASYLSFVVWDITADQYAYRESVGDDTFLGAPASGALSIASDFTLPADHQFRIQYQLILDTYGFSTGLVTGDGHVNFTFTPEPATLAMLAPLLLAFRCRRRRPQRARTLHLTHRLSRHALLRRRPRARTARMTMPVGLGGSPD
jgi:hypothetical protein